MLSGGEDALSGAFYRILPGRSGHTGPKLASLQEEDKWEGRKRRGDVWLGGKVIVRDLQFV